MVLDRGSEFATVRAWFAEAVDAEVREPEQVPYEILSRPMRFPSACPTSSRVTWAALAVSEKEQELASIFARRHRASRCSGHRSSLR